MKRSLPWLLLAIVSTTALAQTDLFCSAGLRPDGFIDLSAMPVSPNFPSGQGETDSAPYIVTLPVTGVPGLTVQITVPPLQGEAGTPVYSVSQGSLVLNGAVVPSASTNGASLVLQFSQPVLGLGLVANSAGREASFSLQTGLPSPPPLNDFQNTVSVFTGAPAYYGTPLEQLDVSPLASGFTTASVSVAPGDFAPASLSNLRVQSSAASFFGLVPTEGLQLWLRSDSVQSPFTGTAASWTDQSGNGHDATQSVAANQPLQIQGDGNACQGAFAFDGNQFFNFNLPIDGWEQMTIFLVGKSSQDPPAGSGAPQASAIEWVENSLWGTTFLSPYQTTAAFRFGTGQAGNQPVYTRPVTVGQDFTITRAVHDGGTDSLYINGLLALSQAGKLSVLAGTSGAGYIGRGINNTYYQGELSEILVYNRVLSNDEAASVEYYLRNKFATR